MSFTPSAGEADGVGRSPSLPQHRSGVSGMFQCHSSKSLDCASDLDDDLPVVPAAGDDLDDDVPVDPREYDKFMDDYPSCLQNFSSLIQAAKSKQLLLFLDYDGTLTPIVPDPNKALMSHEMRAALKRVAAMIPTAIISGRCVEKVVNFVQLGELFYAGSHGLDIQGPGQGLCALKDPSLCSYQPAASSEDTINLVHDALLKGIKDIPGSSVEHNKYCVSAHFRNCAPEDYERVEVVVKDVVKKFNEDPGLRITRGKKVFEVRPNVPWNKGKALLFLLEKLGITREQGAVTLYIGDDITDEDAFKVLAETGHGSGVLVSKKPRDTKAQYSLRDPDEVLQFLQQLGAWLETELAAGELCRPHSNNNSILSSGTNGDC